jgi:hypothetical protein
MKPSAYQEMVQQLVEANISIAKSTESINTNLKILNDNNILHQTETKTEHKQFVDKMQEFTTKYWWLIMAMMIGVFAMVGIKLWS